MSADTCKSAPIAIASANAGTCSSGAKVNATCGYTCPPGYQQGTTHSCHANGSYSGGSCGSQAQCTSAVQGVHATMQTVCGSQLGLHTCGTSCTAATDAMLAAIGAKCQYMDLRVALGLATEMVRTAACARVQLRGGARHWHAWVCSAPLLTLARVCVVAQTNLEDVLQGCDKNSCTGMYYNAKMKCAGAGTVPARHSPCPVPTCLC